MLDHLELLFGSVGTVTTRERLLLGVREVVMPEARRPSESLLAQTTHVRPIVTVLPLVGLQYKTSLEGFSAFLADVGARVAVLCVLVSAEGVRSVGAILTLITCIWLLPCRGQIHVCSSHLQHADKRLI